MKRRFAAGEMVEDVMRREPRTIQIFLKHGMACVGCAIAPYHTVAEASAEYGLRLGAFLQELAAVKDAS